MKRNASIPFAFCSLIRTFASMNDLLKGVDTLVFDFGCVLVDLDKERCIRAWHEIGAGEIARYVDECRQEDLFHDLETGRITVAEFCQEVRRKCAGCTASDDQIRWAWGQLLRGIPKHRVERLRTLKKRYRLLLLSNTNVIHWELCREQLAGCFEHEFLSFEMGLVKPDRAIFEQMVRESGIRPLATLFIDDSLANCESAAALGIRTLHSKDGEEWGRLSEE